MIVLYFILALDINYFSVYYNTFAKLYSHRLICYMIENMLCLAEVSCLFTFSSRYFASSCITTLQTRMPLELVFQMYIHQILIAVR